MMFTVPFSNSAARGDGGCRHAFVRSLLGLLLLIACWSAAAHSLPIGYLRLIANEEYLHMELIFNPFELSFISEIDDDKDGELSANEIKKHGATIATRISRSLRIMVSGKAVTPENAGMDPDMTGHHARLRVHYKVDARKAPVTLISEMQSITSASHLTQVTFSGGKSMQLGQLDSRSVKVTFNDPAPQAKKVEAKPQSHDHHKHE